MSRDALGSRLSLAQFGWGGEGFLWAFWLLGSNPTVEDVHTNIRGTNPLLSAQSS